MNRGLLSILLSLQTSIILACSCGGYINEFCYSADTSDYIALVELIAFDDETAASFKLIENLNKEIPDTINVLGQDGLNCNLGLWQFSIGDTLVINTIPYINGEQNASNLKMYNWGITDCNRHYLEFSKQIVYGKLDTFRKSEEIDYQTFKNDFQECIDFTLSSEKSNIANAIIDIYPNPSNGELSINSKDIRINDVKLYDLQGRKLVCNLTKQFTGYKLDISGNQNGVMLLEIITSKGIIRRKVIKTLR